MTFRPRTTDLTQPARATNAGGEPLLAAGQPGRYPLRVVAFQPTPVPLIQGDDGVIRVAGTRVSVDIIVSAFRAGATPEEITQQYTTVSLEAAYAVIAWILQHEEELDAYLARREAEAETIRKECEARYPQDGIRARLLARRAP